MIRKLLYASLFVIFPTFSYACPDESIWGVESYSLTAGELYSPHRFSVVAGGANELRTECNFIYRRLGSDVGIGYFATRPDFTLDVSGLTQRYDLDISVKSNCDTTLLMNTAARNWFYDDDDGVGDDARIRLTNPRSGIIDIWVGTYGPRNCDAVLKVETF